MWRSGEFFWGCVLRRGRGGWVMGAGCREIWVGSRGIPFRQLIE